MPLTEGPPRQLNTADTLQGTPLTAPVKGLAVKKVGNQAEVIYVK